MNTALNSLGLVLQLPSVGAPSITYPPNDDVLIKNSGGRAGCLYLHPISHLRDSREMRGSSGWVDHRRCR